MIDFEANQRQKIFEPVSTLRSLPTFVFAEDVRMDREFTGFRLFEGLGKIAKLPESRRRARVQSPSHLDQKSASPVLRPLGVPSNLCPVTAFSGSVGNRQARKGTNGNGITPEALYALLASSQEVLVIDVRQPLGLLGDSVIIPGAQWLAPEEVYANPSLRPKERDLVVYCTCPSDKTSRTILHRATAMGSSRLKLLKGGLDGWRTNGFPVEPYAGNTITCRMRPAAAKTDIVLATFRKRL